MPAENPKLITAMAKLVAAMHDTITECEIDDAEWRQAIAFLGEVHEAGEWFLLSDVLGVSVLVDQVTHGSEPVGTDHSVEGPFYRPDAPLRTQIARDDEPGDVCFFSGQVVSSADGSPVGGALLDVWQAAANGRYEQEDPEQPDMNLRGRLYADDGGNFELRTILPPAYEIPKSGPVGRLLAALGRHAWRPAHFHLKLTADRFDPLTTMIFMAGDAWLDSDTIGAAKPSLTAKPERHDDPDELAARGLEQPFYTCRYDLALRPL
jgi:protocatechuate 3,4-dioxygenase beta subunit